MTTNLKYISAIWFCCMTIATEHASAQRFALQGGIENTTIKFDGKPDYISTKTGFNFGCLGEIPVNNRKTLNINMGLDFTLRGYKEEQKEYEHRPYILHNRLYMEFPLVLSYRFNIVEDVFSVLPCGGMFFCGFLSISDSDGNEYKPDDDAYYRDNYGRIKNFNYGLRFGGAVEIVNNIQFAVEKNIGISPVYKDSYTKITNIGTRFCIRLFF